MTILTLHDSHTLYCAFRYNLMLSTEIMENRKFYGFDPITAVTLAAPQMSAEMKTKPKSTLTPHTE